MTEIKGVLTTLNHQLPDGLDAVRLAQWQMREGTDYLTFRNQIAAAFDGLNAEILEAWGDLVYVTNNDHFEYPNGGAVTDMADVTELDRVEPRKGSTVGHMIDLRRKADGIGGSKYYFRDTRMAVITASIRDITQRGRQTLEKAVLTRAMTSSENLLGTSGYDVGFASASGSVTYTPPAYGGSTFTSSHTHYVGFASASKGFNDMLDELAEHLHEHGHGEPFIAYVAASDVKANYATLKGFSKPISDRIVVVDRGNETATAGNAFFERGQITARPNMGGYRIGSYLTPFGEVELRATARIPAGYALMYKSYGMNDPRNPIAIRVHPDVGFGFRLVEEPSFDAQYPVKQVNVEIEYGISCGQDRTVGAAGYRVSGGVWANPTIS